MAELFDQMTWFPDEALVSRARAGDSVSVDVESVDTVRSRSLGLLVLSEIRETFQSVREASAPRTVLHALITRDGQSVAELQSRSSMSDDDTREVLDALIQMSLISSIDDHGVARYSLAPDVE